MSTELDSTSLLANSRRKGLFSPAHWPKKLRSKDSRSKRRLLLLPFSDEDSLLEVEGEKGVEAEHSGFHADSSSSSCFASVITSESSLLPSRSGYQKKRPREAPRQSTANDVAGGNSGDEFRRVTRLYARQIENQKLEENSVEECSGINSSSGAREEGKISNHGANYVAVDGRAGETDAEFTVSEISHISGGIFDGNHKKKARSNRARERPPEISESSCLESINEAKGEKLPKSPEISQNSAICGEEIGRGEVNLQLACSEQLSIDGESSAYSTCNEMSLSEFESELFGGSSADYFSDLSQSFLTESSDNFSEKSPEDKPSVAFSLYLQLAQQFSLLPPPEAPQPETEYSDEFTQLRFENEDEEESYKMFRGRERRIQLYDYTNEKSMAAEYRVMVLQERMLMVNWIVKHSNAVQLQNETLFLGVSLMDRFLCRGFFKTKRNLHLLGIACVTLATRLEENQPYNSVRRKTFLVGDHAYSRSEVVAMEWLVQEVLHFQCFLPTIYNFLWFYLKAAKAGTEVESIAKYLAVISLMDHKRLRFWPSTVAAGLVVLASLAADCDGSCQLVMETHVRSSNDDLSECIKSLEWLVKHATALESDQGPSHFAPFREVSR